MTGRLTEKEWELLSAYLDGEVSDSDSEKVEQALRRDSQQSEAYQSLERTRAVLKSTFRVKRRRNFYLSPNMVRRVTWNWIIPVLNFGSAATAILAVVLFVFQQTQPFGTTTRSIAAGQAAPQTQEFSLPAAADTGLETLSSPSPTDPTDIMSENSTGIQESQSQLNMTGPVDTGETAAAPPLQEQAPAGAAAPAMKAVPESEDILSSPPAAGEEGEQIPPAEMNNPSLAGPTAQESEKPSPTGNSAEEKNELLPTAATAKESAQSPVIPPQPEQVAAGESGETNPEISSPIQPTRVPIVEPQQQPQKKGGLVQLSSVQAWITIAWALLLGISVLLALLGIMLRKRMNS